MTKIGLLWICAGIIMAGFPVAPLQAESPPPESVVDVVASGVGKDETEATKDALRNAVRQAIGAIVGIDTLIENEAVVRDQILTYSDGFVEKYEQVGPSVTTLSGLVSVTIRALIVRGKLMEKTRAANISVLKVDGTGMFAEVVTKMEKEKSAASLLAEEFREMPKKLIKAEVIGKPTYDDKTRKVKVAVRTSVDRRAFDAFSARLKKLLDGFNVESFPLASSDASINNYSRDRAPYVFRVNFPLSLFPQSYLSRMGDRDLSTIMLCVRANDNLSSSQWRMYFVDQDMLMEVNEMLHPVTVSVEVMGNNQDVLDSHFIVIGAVDNYNRRFLDGPVSFAERGYRDAGFELVVYPGLCEAPSIAQWGHISLCVDEPLHLDSLVEFDMSPDRLKDIAQVVCKVTSAGSTVKE